MPLVLNRLVTDIIQLNKLTFHASLLEKAVGLLWPGYHTSRKQVVTVLAVLQSAASGEQNFMVSRN